ncbi:hypothetical protein VTJ49DRAFT_5712 [Mycothermus thermophilus]|uniref:Flavin-nucleotide-binding protein n=1 Tax=Humicola insolens TaxID=85995 RepID=A0ABR3VK16_HUMIN
MPIRELQYPTESYSKVNRHRERADYALETIHGIVNSCPLLHVSFQDPDSPFPAVLPMMGQMGSFDRPSAGLGDVLDLYLHSYVSARIVNLVRASSLPDSEGLPITIAATHLDGLVLALTPHSHSFNYRSALLFGHAHLVTSTDEKLYALELITNSVLPNRWSQTRIPPTPAEMQSTAVLRVRITSGSAKIRSGGPKDGDKRDLADEELLGRVWTGVVPVYTTLGEPVAGGYNRVEGVPDETEKWRKERNGEAEGFATEAVKEG